MALAFVAGLIAGIALGYFLIRSRIARSIRRRVARWQAEEEARIADEAERRSEAVLTGRIGEQFAPLWLDFPFAPSDVRFIGSPIDFIVFDGCTDVRIGRATNLREIVFVDIKTGKARLNTIQRRIRQCVEAGHVRCELIEMPAAEQTHV